MDGRVLLVDDEVEILQGLRVALMQEGLTDVVGVSSVGAAKREIRSRPWDLVIVDLMLPDGDGLELLSLLGQQQPDAESLVLSAVDQADTAVRALGLGARDYLTKPIDRARLLEAVGRCLSSVQRPSSRAERTKPEALSEFLTQSPQLLEMFDYLERVAQTHEDLLILGPTGSGKELLARGVHQLSELRDGPFVGVNVAAIPSELFASHLFGHTAGSFSGASSAHTGFFAEAEGGVLFLDEVGELEPGLQTQLLRVLQEREYRPLGGKAGSPLKCRVVFASNRDLDGEIRAGRFREDLYHRISATQVSVPALEERPEDIPILVEHYVSEFATRYRKSIRLVQPRTMRTLCEASYSGNVRELQNVLREAVLREVTDELTPRSLPKRLRRRRRDPTDAGFRPLADLERDHISQVFGATQGNVSKAARILGISRATLTRRLKDYRVGIAAR